MWIIIVVVLLMVFPLLIHGPKKKLPKKKVDALNPEPKSNEAYGRRECVGYGEKNLWGTCSGIYKDPVRITDKNGKTWRIPKGNTYDDWYSFGLSSNDANTYKTKNMVLKEEK